MRPTTPRISPVGLSGLAVSFADELSEAANRAALAFRAAVEAESWPGVEECSTSLTSTFIRFDPLGLSFEALQTQVDALLQQQDWRLAELPQGRRHFRIPCVFGGDLGPQFSAATAAAGLSEPEALRQLTEGTTRVLTIGFAPGQPYAGQLPPQWDIPRLTELTPKVPQGALVVAIRQLIIFANDTPTGWRHIGQTGFRCFDPQSDTPFALRPGDELSFRAINAEELENIQADPTAGNGGAEVRALS